ncbi:hypothetical protein [Nocardia beijingensis]
MGVVGAQDPRGGRTRFRLPQRCLRQFDIGGGRHVHPAGNSRPGCDRGLRMVGHHTGSELQFQQPRHGVDQFGDFRRGRLPAQSAQLEQQIVGRRVLSISAQLRQAEKIGQLRVRAVVTLGGRAPRNETPQRLRHLYIHWYALPDPLGKSRQLLAGRHPLPAFFIEQAQLVLDAVDRLEQHRRIVQQLRCYAEPCRYLPTGHVSRIVSGIDDDRGAQGRIRGAVEEVMGQLVETLRRLVPLVERNSVRDQSVELQRRCGAIGVRGQRRLGDQVLQSCGYLIGVELGRDTQLREHLIQLARQLLQWGVRRQPIREFLAAVGDVVAHLSHLLTPLICADGVREPVGVRTPGLEHPGLFDHHSQLREPLLGDEEQPRVFRRSVFHRRAALLEDHLLQTLGHFIRRRVLRYAQFCAQSVAFSPQLRQIRRIDFQQPGYVVALRERLVTPRLRLRQFPAYLLQPRGLVASRSAECPGVHPDVLAVSGERARRSATTFSARAALHRVLGADRALIRSDVTSAGGIDSDGVGGSRTLFGGARSVIATVQGPWRTG